MIGCQSLPGFSSSEAEADEAAAETTAEAFARAWGKSESLSGEGEWDESAATASTSSTDRGPMAEVRVERGDTAWSIARRYGMSVDELVVINGLGDRDQLTVGDTLHVPEARVALVETPGASPSPSEAESSAPASAPTVEYRVQPGETMWRIATRHGMTPRELADQNGIEDATSLLAGTVLRVPGAARQPAKAEPDSLAPVSAAPPSMADIAEPDLTPEAPKGEFYRTASATPEDPYAAIDDVLDLGDRYLDSARFKESIDLADLGLQMLSEHWTRTDADSRIARAELMRGIALVALQQPAAGHNSFRRALRVEPDIVLGADASPKILTVFEAAREEVEAAREGAEAP